MGWDGLGWAGMGWDGLGWAGMGWEGMGWAGTMELDRNVMVCHEDRSQFWVDSPFVGLEGWQGIGWDRVCRSGWPMPHACEW